MNRNMKTGNKPARLYKKKTVEIPTTDIVCGSLVVAAISLLITVMATHPMMVI